MYFIWFLAAAGVLLIGLGLKRLFAGQQSSLLTRFKESDSATSASENYATPGFPLNSSEIPSDQRFEQAAQIGQQLSQQVVESTRASASPATGFQNQGGGRQSAGTAALSAESLERMNRLSTWDDRRLFGEFRGILSGTNGTTALPLPEELPISTDELIFGGVTPALAQLLPESEVRREIQRKNLTAAGYHSRGALLNLSAIRFVLAFLSVVVLGGMLIIVPEALESWLLSSLVMIPLILWALPPLYVAYQARDRMVDIDRGIPDVLDMLNMAVSQGLNVPQALRRISTEIGLVHPALAVELRIVDHQTRVGSLVQALKNFGQRIESPEVSSFTSLLIQSESTGTGISKALAEHSDSIRATLKERADARANAASFQLLFPVSLFLLPSVFLFLLGPAIVQMSDFVNNQAQQIQESRQEAVRSLQQTPQQNPISIPGS